MSDCFLEAYQGDTFSFVATVKDSAGVAVDLTGATFRFAIGSLINESTSGVSISAGDSTGIITVIVSYTAMETLTDSEYEMALEYTKSGIRETIFTATLSLKEDVR